MDTLLRIAFEIILLLTSFGIAIVLRITDGLPKRVSVPGYFVAVFFFLAFLSVAFNMKTLNGSIMMVGICTIITIVMWIYLVIHQPMSVEKKKMLEKRLIFWAIPAIMLIIALLFFERQPSTRYLDKNMPQAGETAQVR
jgi:hypothetical protein